MKVKELIEMLNEVDPEREVIIAKDEEGNSFSPFSGDYWECAYLAETKSYGEAGLEKLTDEDIERGYDEEDVLEDGVPAVVLWPVN